MSRRKSFFTSVDSLDHFIDSIPDEFGENKEYSDRTEVSLQKTRNKITVPVVFSRSTDQANILSEFKRRSSTPGDVINIINRKFISSKNKEENKQNQYDSITPTEPVNNPLLHDESTANKMENQKNDKSNDEVNRAIENNSKPAKLRNRAKRETQRPYSSFYSKRSSKLFTKIANLFSKSRN
ncbi:MAG: hypothetical protein MHMPM18_003030 [Marteilia pararefringens]